MTARGRLMLSLVALLLVAGPLQPHARAQPQRGRGAGPPPSAREAAPVDLTGYWVSVISEDYRWRMVTPLRGDFASVPLNAEGRRVAEAWDPVADEAAGLACKAYGAAAIMRVPGRVHITWEDDATLRLDLDAGTQTRRFRFGGAAEAAPSWQGDSIANWERPPQGEGNSFTIPVFAGRTGTRGKSLEVVTTRLRPGYLRKNGVPYSDRTTVTEYYDYRTHPDGEEWFTVTTVVRDPVYLTEPFITSSDFKREPDASGWRPTPCEAR